MNKRELKQLIKSLIEEQKGDNIIEKIINYLNSDISTVDLFSFISDTLGMEYDAKALKKVQTILQGEKDLMNTTNYTKLLQAIGSDLEALKDEGNDYTE